MKIMLFKTNKSLRENKSQKKVRTAVMTMMASTQYSQLGLRRQNVLSLGNAD